MKNRYELIFSLAFTFIVAILPSCILEYPDGDGVDPTSISVGITFATSPLVEENPLSKNTLESRTSVYRFKAVFYEDDFDGKPLFERVVYAESVSGSVATVRLDEKLHALNYKISLWVEEVLSVESKSPIYNSDDLKAITFRDGYVGGDPLKLCFSGVYTLDLREYADRKFATIDKDFVADMPVATVRIVSTDFHEFLETNSLENIDGYTVIWEYSSYVPVGFNVLTQKPNAAEMGQSFTLTLSGGNDEFIDLGTDYIFVNGGESYVVVNLTILNADGEEINTYQGLELPIRKGKLTVIKGEYLTRSKTTGIGIDAGFDGEFNIELP